MLTIFLLVTFYSHKVHEVVHFAIIKCFENVCYTNFTHKIRYKNISLADIKPCESVPDIGNAKLKCRKQMKVHTHSNLFVFISSHTFTFEMYVLYSLRAL